MCSFSYYVLSIKTFKAPSPIRVIIKTWTGLGEVRLEGGALN